MEAPHRPAGQAARRPGQNRHWQKEIREYVGAAEPAETKSKGWGLSPVPGDSAESTSGDSGWLVEAGAAGDWDSTESCTGNGKTFMSALAGMASVESSQLTLTCGQSLMG